ncbi:MAG: glycosyl hydrolase [Bacillota bacterium]
MEAEDHKKVRFDYWDVITRRFVNAFTKNIYNWCEENNINFTGHFWEHVFPSPLHTGSTMPHYEYMQVPGIDMLFNTEKRKDQVGNDLIVKEVSSVANQLGKKRVLSETYGASGWELDFKEQKRVADWQFALGINLVCQHLTLFSLEGYRKRDFPLSFMDHQPWWDCYHLLGDYIGRLSYILSQGKYTGDILLLHPSSSTWTEFDLKSDVNEHNEIGNNEIGDKTKELTKFLSRNQYLFDLGDDLIIEKYAEINQDIFKIKEKTYKTIILPDMTVMRSSNFELLKEFAENGGKIIVTGTTPYLLEGKENEELKAFFNHEKIYNAKSTDDIINLLDQFQNEKVNLVEKNGKKPENIYVHKRIDGSKEIIFLSNFSKKEKYEVEIETGNNLIEKWNPVSGKKQEISPRTSGNQFVVKLTFEPVQSHLLVIDKEEKLSEIEDNENTSYEKSTVDNEKQEKKVINFDKSSGWKVKRSDYNALTINQCQVKVDNSQKETAWSEKENVVKQDDKLKEKLGLDKGHIFSPQPWTYSQEEKENTFKVEAKYTFKVKDDLSGKVMVAAEYPEVFNIYINDKQIKPLDKYYKDRAFNLYDITENVTTGKNEILLKTDKYGVMVSLESMYIVGEFIVEKTNDNQFVLKEEKEYQVLGDWTQQGYPFYSGKMVYKCTFNLDDDFKKVECHLQDLWGVAFKIKVNGQEAKILGWEPFAADISQYVQPGENIIEIEVMNSLQNLLGPHNYLEIEGLVTPGSFYSSKQEKFIKSGFSGKMQLKVY